MSGSGLGTDTMRLPMVSLGVRETLGAVPVRERDARPNEG